MVQTHQFSLEVLNQLESIHKQAGLDNRHLTCEIFVVNKKGELFGQKRSSNRVLFPNCWDVPGGHLDEGESLIQCIVRELKEETHWDLNEILHIFGVKDWEVESDIPQRWNTKKRMIILLVTVQDEKKFILEEGKVTEGAWFNKVNLNRLAEGRKSGDNWRVESFEQVFAFLDRK